MVLPSVRYTIRPKYNTCGLEAHTYILWGPHLNAHGQIYMSWKHGLDLDLHMEHVQRGI